MTKPSNRLGMYSDVQFVLDEAIMAGGGDYHCPNHGAAVHWRQRAYKFRKLFAEINGEKNTSRYDKLVMPRIPPESSTVHITVRKQVGVFTPREGGTPIDIGDELFEAAAALRAKIEES